MPAPVALIIGITGQDGSFLAELLLRRGYVVHGLRRRTSWPNLGHLAGILGELTLHHGDVTEGASLLRVLQRVRPDEVYNLAGAGLAAECAPQHAARLHTLGTQRLLDALRLHDPSGTVRLLQGSGHEIFGEAGAAPADETTACRPRTALGVAWLQAHHLVIEARERLGMHASSSISFPHGSARAGPHNMLRQLVHAAVSRRPLGLPSLDAAQHCGHARDHAEAMWRMLQQDRPGDVVLAAGPAHPLRHVVERVFALAGTALRWTGSGAAETGLCAGTGRLLVSLDPAARGGSGAIGDAGRARRLLGWAPADALEQVLAELLADERPA